MQSATTTSIALVDAVRLSDWSESRNLSRSTTYELLKLLQIEPEARRVPTSRKPVSHLTIEQVEMLDPFAAEINRGATLPHLRECLKQSAIVPTADGPEQSAIVPVSPEPRGAEPTVVVNMPADRLARARGLAELAASCLPITNEDLSALVGVDTTGWKDRELKYGYRFHKRHQTKDDGKECQAVVWLVERDTSLAIGEQQAPAALQPAPVEHRGMFGLMEDMARPAAFLAPPVEIAYRVMGRELFDRNRIG